MVAPAIKVVPRLVEAGLLTVDAGTIRLTAQGRLLSNDVFQEFLGLEPDADAVGREQFVTDGLS